MKILVLSPHADDAVFSCHDHMRHWVNQGHTVTVCTIFSKFNPTTLNPDAERYMKHSGFTSTTAFEEARKKEDRAALGTLGIHLLCADFVDGAFRLYGGRLNYPSFGKLFSGLLSAQDDELTRQVISYMHTLGMRFDRVLAPIGMGSHADHLLTALCAKQAVPKNKLHFYYDAPYFFDLQYWKKRYVFPLLTFRISVRWTTHAKISAMYRYRSQIHLILRANRTFFFREGFIYFPEIVVPS